MLTFCRRFRTPKGVRKPGVGPVACYRGVGRTKFEQYLCEFDRWSLVGGPGNSHRARIDWVRAALLSRKKPSLDDSTGSSGRIDGYQIYILLAQA